jgi:hypothetical protein
MKATKKWGQESLLGMLARNLLIALVLAFGLVVVGCKDGNEGADPVDFTYTIVGGNITITKYKGTSNTVDIPSTIEGKPVTAIGGSAFFECSSLTSVTIPNSVTSIGSAAFAGCSSLTSVTIPNSVTSIGNQAFRDCSSLMSITVEGENMSYKSVEGVLFNKAGTNLIRYPEGKTGSTYTIPDSVTTIGVLAFACDNLTSVTLGSGITTWGANGSHFPGDLKAKYQAAGGGAGTYTRPDGDSNTWTKQ